eukprot:TRINITY_DN73702_c0_g1_i1.p1 TRINITY_DN73702_c0_g1~~TRINITY_DN73702_c0_g1_i1.p1  ORF type:complete len:1154 (-),score=255.18 TRINITY_DN73702_c0_g1_i1:77-3460(-)
MAAATGSSGTKMDPAAQAAEDAAEKEELHKLEEELEKPEVPWCALCLSLVCVLLHFMTLWGHLSAASAFSDLGQSSAGWARVGLSVSYGLDKELDAQLLLVEYNISNITKKIVEVESNIDGTLSTVGDGIDSLLSMFEQMSAKKSAAAVSLLQDSVSNDEEYDAQISHVNALYDEIMARKLGANSSGMDDWIAHARGVGLNQERSVMDLSDLVSAAGSSQDLDGLLGLSTRRTRSKSDAAASSQMQGFPAIDGEKLKQTFMDAIKKAILVTLLKKFIAMVPPKDLKAMLLPLIRQLVTSFLNPVNEALTDIMTQMKPTLITVAEYTARMSPEASKSLNEVGWVMDRTQKLYDQIVANVKSVDGDISEKAKLSNLTFKVFDVNKDKEISREEYDGIAKVFQLEVLQDASGDSLWDRFAKDAGKLDGPAYFGLMCDDETASTIVKIITEIGERYNSILSTLKSSEADGPLAMNIAKLISVTLVMGREISNITAPLVNGSLSDTFTASVIMSLTQVNDTAMGKIGPATGQVALKQMLEQNATTVILCLKMLSEPKFWGDRGFDDTKQPEAVKKLTSWLHQADSASHDSQHHHGKSIAKGSKTTTAAPASFLQMQSEELLEALVGSNCSISEASNRGELERALLEVEARAAEKQAIYSSMVRGEAAIERTKDFASGISRCLRLQLLGGISATNGAEQDDETKAEKTTMNYSRGMANVSSTFISELYEDCQAFAGRSCNIAESVGGMVKKMVENLKKFMKIMNKYATPEGVELIYEEVQGFQDKAADSIILILLIPIDHFLPDDPAHPPPDGCVVPVGRALPPMQSSGVGMMMGGGGMSSLLQVNEAKALLDAELSGVGNVFKLVTETLHKLNAELPKTIEAIDEARKQIRTVSAALKGPFKKIRDTAPALFASIAFYYKVGMWVYFIIVGGLTLLLLYYSFWAAGYMGGPAATDDDYEAPQTCWERCMCCYRCCCACCTKFEDSELCFWALIWSMKFFVLILFLMSLVFVIIAGVYLGTATGCGSSETTAIGSIEECETSMKQIQGVLHTFLSNDTAEGAISDACLDYKLTTCVYLQAEFWSAGFYIALGSLPVPILTFYLLFLSAVAHEQARWRRMFEEVIAKMEKDGVV